MGGAPIKKYEGAPSIGPNPSVITSTTVNPSNGGGSTIGIASGMVNNGGQGGGKKNYMSPYS